MNQSQTIKAPGWLFLLGIDLMVGSTWTGFGQVVFPWQLSNFD